VVLLSEAPQKPAPEPVLPGKAETEAGTCPEKEAHRLRSIHKPSKTSIVFKQFLFWHVNGRYLKVILSLASPQPTSYLSGGTRYRHGYSQCWFEPEEEESPATPEQKGA